MDLKIDFMNTFKPIIHPLVIFIALTLNLFDSADAQEVKAPKLSKNVKNIAEGNNQFGLDLYKELAESEGNLFFSPFSIRTGLAMVYAGAEGETAKEMETVLKIDKPSVFHPAMAKRLNRFKIQETPKSIQPIYLANRIWPDKSTAIEKQFQKTLKNHYGSSVQQLDFSQPDQARNTINQWVEKQTNAQIKNGAGDLAPETRLALTSCIYFNSNWLVPFLNKDTKPAPFHLQDSTTTEVDMMNLESKFGYADLGHAKIVNLTYTDSKTQPDYSKNEKRTPNYFSMTIILPNKVDELAEIESTLSVKKISEWESKLKPLEGKVSIPKFDLSAKSKLNNALRSLGMKSLFSGSANLSGVAAGLTVFDASQSAKITVNEQGTEASDFFWGGISLGVDFPPPEPFTFTADHPFLFLIKDHDTGCILFIGRMVNPSK